MPDMMQLRDVEPGNIVRFPGDKKPTKVRRVDRCDSWPASNMHINESICAAKATHVESAS